VYFQHWLATGMASSFRNQLPLMKYTFPPLPRPLFPVWEEHSGMVRMWNVLVCRERMHGSWTGDGESGDNWLTKVHLEGWPLNWCVCVCLLKILAHCELYCEMGERQFLVTCTFVWLLIHYTGCHHAANSVAYCQKIPKDCTRLESLLISASTDLPIRQSFHLLCDCDIHLFLE